MSREWAPETQDRWFYATLALSAVAVGVLLLPFVDVIAYAAVVATVSTPVHRVITRRLGGRRLVGAVVTTLLVGVLVLWPLALLLYQFALEAVSAVRAALAWTASGHLDVWLEEGRAWWESEGMETVRGIFPSDTDPVQALLGALREAVPQGLSATSSVLPQLLGGMFTGVLDLVLFVFTVVVLLADGHTLRSFLFDLTPLDNRYEERLAGVFEELATNVVLGAFAVALAQGLIATVGYGLMGLPRALFFGIMTGVCALVPVVGTAVVAGPVVLWTTSLYGWGWGLVMLVYAVVAIGGVDNVIRPMVIRGKTNIHPLLIFFAVFGGISWMGLAGALLGPMIVAGFLSLAMIHRERTELVGGGDTTGT
ncbi:MAG: AI-2E family transporter [Alphaproteobacteria bacterium]|nr:AI-2E family transporter [Alphaproteobacteria bacterium]